MANETLASMTIEQLDELLLAGNADLDARKDELRKLRGYRDEREAVESVAKKVAAMSSAERRALAQTISAAGGVPTRAAVGTPGT